MIPAGSLIWPVVLKALRWAFDLLFGWATKKAREPSTPQEPPILPPEPIVTPTNPSTSEAPVQPVVVTAHDQSSAALAGVAVQGVEAAHSDATAAATARAAVIDGQSGDQLAETVNNVYQVPSTHNPSKR